MNDKCAFCGSLWNESETHPGTCANCGAPPLASLGNDTLGSIALRPARYLEELIVSVDMEMARIDKDNEEFIRNCDLKKIDPSMRETIKMLRKQLVETDLTK